MKKFTSTLIAFIAATVMMAQGMVFEPEGTTLEQASAKAKAENKLIFLDCFTSWCGPCKKMARDVFPQEQVGAFMNPRFVNIKIDMESAYGAPLEFLYLPPTTVWKVWLLLLLSHFSRV